jgi:hypothetical protein
MIKILKHQEIASPSNKLFQVSIIIAGTNPVTFWSVLESVLTSLVMP